MDDNMGWIIKSNIIITSSFLVLGVDEFGGDSIESSSSLLWDHSRVDLQLVSLLVFFDYFLLLQLLQAPSDDLWACVLVSGVSAGDSVLLAVEVGEQVDSGPGPEVDFTSECGNSVVDPVVVEGGEFVGWIKLKVPVDVLTTSAHLGLSIKLFFFKYWAKALMKSAAEMSFTV